MNDPLRGPIAVIGAGMAGLACAERLSRAGVAVTIFDKGRRPGGRMATRDRDGMSFDHGAQYATARNADFQTAMRGWRTAGLAHLWSAASTAGNPRWVGTPGMATIPAKLATSLTRAPDQGRQVTQIIPAGDVWLLRHHDAAAVEPGALSMAGGETDGPFEAVLVAIPAPQARALLAGASEVLAARVDQARMAPCWTVMAVFDRTLDLSDIGRPGAGLPPSGPIGWFAREGSRPGRAPTPERFVIHATAEWSRDHLERSEGEAADRLLRALPAGVTPLSVMAHRWRYAQVERPLGQACLWDGQAGIGVCGDWCLGGRVEAAWDSGRALAEAVLAW